MLVAQCRAGGKYVEAYHGVQSCSNILINDLEYKVECVCQQQNLLRIIME